MELYISQEISFNPLMKKKTEIINDSVDLAQIH